ncbi:MAG TPA: methylamine utilization protein [Rhodanobacteraceae bacterium]|nr:methylamine utilization protein [Rhodanobacteraceae bacterium]
MRWFRFATAVAGMCLSSAPAYAAGVGVRISDTRGHAVADAVVTIAPQSGASVAPAPPAATRVIDQKNETFIPYIEVFRPGDKVVFHNSDNTRHHAYSFAPAGQFEFVLAPGESSAPLQLDKLGVIAVGCNIHDQMITYLYVTDTPLVAHSGGDGIAQLSNLPKGDYAVRVWHPQLRPGAGADLQRLTITDASELRDLEFTLSLLPDPRLPPDRERAGY